jgi:hypothetical protein
MWFKGNKTAKEKEKNYFPAFPTAWDKAVGKARLVPQQNMPALPTRFLCQQLCPLQSCWRRERQPS